jgi:ribosome-interacting GTPase 1
MENSYTTATGTIVKSQKGWFVVGLRHGQDSVQAVMAIASEAGIRVYTRQEVVEIARRLDDAIVAETSNSTAFTRRQVSRLFDLYRFVCSNAVIGG